MDSLDLRMAYRLDEWVAVASTSDEWEPTVQGKNSVASCLARWQATLQLEPDGALTAWALATNSSKAAVLRAIERNPDAAPDGSSLAWQASLYDIFQAFEHTCYLESDTIDEKFRIASVAWPWLRWTTEQLRARLSAAGSVDKVCNESLLISFQTTLLYDVVQLLERTVVLELNVAKARNQLRGETSEERFGNFCADLTRRERAASFFQEYIVLARILTEHCMTWAEAQIELLDRLEQDWGILLSSKLIHPEQILTDVNPVGDRHFGGRRVSILVFGHGASKLVYKPRSVASEKLLHNLASQMNLDLPIPCITVPEMLDCVDHAWVRYAPSDKGRGDFPKLAYRAGAMLSLAHAFGVRDLTDDNVIVLNDAPVIIDGECILWPEFAEDAREHAWYHSLVCTGILPGLRVNGSPDLSFLGSTGGGEHSRYSVSQIEGWNTDSMSVVRGLARFDSQGKGLGQRFSYEPAVVESVVQGFVDGSRSILTRATEYQLCIDQAAREHMEAKYLPRASAVYAKLLHEMLHPNLLRDALDCEALIARAYSSNIMSGCLFPAEREALWRRDIPVFSVRPDKTDIFVGGRTTIENVFRLSGQNAVANRIVSMADASIQEYNARVIRTTFDVVGTNRNESLKLPEYRGDIGAFALSLADSLATYLTERMSVDRGRVYMVDVTEDATARAHAGTKVEVLGNDLYWGLSGIFVFLASAAEHLKDRRYTQIVNLLARQLLGAAERELRYADEGKSLAGSFHGPSSILYALELGRAFVEPQQLEHLQTKLFRYAISSRERDDKLDVLSGSAGLALVIDAFSNRNGPNTERDFALTVCVQRLVDASINAPDGMSWITHNKTKLTGFGHGASGIAVALDRASRRFSRSDLGEYAQAAIAWENAHFSSGEQNWSDLRTLGYTNPSEQKYALGWCAGAPGIGLARESLLRSRFNAQISRDLESAFETTSLLHHSLSTDGLCHGRFGCVDMLLDMIPGVPDIRDAEQQVQMSIDRLFEDVTRNGFRFLTRCAPSGFMLGVSGIGYTLLRIAGASSTPSVLSVSI